MARDEGKLRVISADGKGIMMHPKGPREAARRDMEREEHKQHTWLSPGEKKNRKRMATVAAVYEVDPYPRTANKQLGQSERQPVDNAADADPSGRERGGLKWTVCQLHNGTEKPI